MCDPGGCRRRRWPRCFCRLRRAGLRTSRAPRATMLVRGAAGAASLAAVRDLMASLHPDLTVFNVQTMQRESRPDQRVCRVDVGGLRRPGPVLAAPRLHRPGWRHGLRGGAKAEGDRHPYGARCPRPAGARTGAEGRDGAGSGRIAMRLWRRDGPPRAFSAYSETLAKSFAQPRHVTRCCLPERRSCWAPWRCWPVTCRRGAPRGSTPCRRCGKSDGNRTKPALRRFTFDRTDVEPRLQAQFGWKRPLC